MTTGKPQQHDRLQLELQEKCSKSFNSLSLASIMANKPHLLHVLL